MKITKIVGQIGKGIVWMSILSIGLSGVVAHYALPTQVYKEVIGVFSDAIYQQELKLATSPIANMTHRILGLAFFIVGMLQFNKTLRSNNPKLHRFFGRAYINLAFIVIVTATILSKRHAFAGELETIAVIGVNTLFGTLVLIGLYHAHRKSYHLHRDYMIRGFACALFVAFHRPYFISGLLFLNLPEQVLFLVSGAVSLAFCMISAEIWIWLSRRTTHELNVT